MTCAEAEIMLHALLDGELDAGHAFEVETHLTTCPRCAAQLRAYRELQQAMPAAQLRFAAPMSLRRRIEAALPSPPARVLEPPLRAQGLCHGFGALGRGGGDPGRGRHPNRPGPARARATRFRRICARFRASISPTCRRATSTP